MNPIASPWSLGGMGGVELVRRVWRRSREDRIADQSAKLSFYFLLSLFPLLFFVTSILGLVLRRGERASRVLHEMLASVLPPSAWELVAATLGEIAAGPGSLGAGAAVVVTVWTASRGTVAIIEGLNVAYEVRQYRSWWRRNVLAMGLTLAFMATVVVALPILIYGARAAESAARYFAIAGIDTAWSIAEKVVAIAIVLAAFNVLYIVGPNVENRRWHWLMPGTVVAVLLWLLASYGFKMYLHFFDRYSATYGSIGAVVVLMLWFYLTGIALLVGGEVNSEIEKAVRRGEPALPKEE